MPRSVFTGARRRLRRPSPYQAVAVAVATLAIGGVAYATIPSNGVISGCYQKSGGTLRVIDATTGSCSSKETSLNWNVQGAQGPQGPAGATGATGPAGARGPAGISGYELIKAESDDIDFDGNRLDVFAKCPAGKRFLGGGYAFYTIPPGYAPQYTPPERVNALPETNFDGIDQYYVTVIHPIPDGYGAKLKAVAACANVAG
jgi:hypothetical protein